MIFRKALGNGCFFDFMNRVLLFLNKGDLSLTTGAGDGIL